MTVKSNTNDPLLKNADPQKRLSSDTNDSSSRKFTSEDQVMNFEDKSERDVSNDEHIVAQAVGLKSLSIAIDVIVKKAKKSLSDTRDEISSVGSSETDTDPRQKKSSLTDADIQIMKNKQMSDVATAVSGLNKSISDNVNSVARDAINNSMDAVMPQKEQGDSKLPVNFATPEFDHIEVDVDKKRGSVDCFYTKLVFSVNRNEISNGNVKKIRVMRSSVPYLVDKKQKRLSMNGVDKIRANRNRSSAKNQDYSSDVEKRLAENSIDNSITSLMSFDLSSNSRVSSVKKEKRAVDVGEQNETMKNVNKALLSSFLSTEDVISLDSSVAKDLNSLKNIKLQNSALSETSVNQSLVVGRNVVETRRLSSAQTRQMREGNDNLGQVVLQRSNEQMFKEIAFVSPDKLASRIVGDYIEFTMYDDSVQYGNLYRYYAITVDKNLNESIRSRFVDVITDGTRVPEFVSNVNVAVTQNRVSLSMLTSDQLIEKFEVYRKESDLSASPPNSVRASSISGQRGFLVDDVTNSRLKNNFIQMGESLNDSTAGSSFNDSSVIAGRSYVYRIYSVDVFGNKSERPKEINVFVPEPFRQSDLVKPSILAEVDAKTNRTRITFECRDDRVIKLFLKRKDLTTKQRAFAAPCDTNDLSFRGSVQIDTPRLNARDPSFVWNGVFDNRSEPIVFIDKVAQIEHTYQYSLYGVDKFGKQTQSVFSSPLFVVRRQFVNAPINLTPFITYDNGHVSQIRLAWEEGNDITSSEDKLGSQTALQDTSVRTLYQVERKRKGDELWEQFPMTENTELVDRSVFFSGSTSPEYRPDFVTENESYLYRVQALQTGSFISNFCEHVSVWTGLPLSVPLNFRLVASNAKVRPFFVMLNWDTAAGSGVVDFWEIERAEINNFAARGLNVRNPSSFNEIVYSKFRTVFRESSRSRASSIDSTVDTFRKEMTGEHYFQDVEVKFGNSYFYRIRAVSIAGEVSDWVYRGMKVTDEIFEKKQNELLTSEEKRLLASSFVPMTMRGNTFRDSSESELDSFSIRPRFSRVDKTLEATHGVKKELAVKKESAMKKE